MAVKCESCGHSHDDWVPKSRLDRAIEVREAAKESEDRAKIAMESLQSDLRDARKATKAAEKLAAAGEANAAEVASLTAKLADMERQATEWQTERAVMGAGITDPEGIAFARFAFDRLPEDARPSGGIVEWIGGDRDGLPKALLAYLPEPVALEPEPVPASQPPPWSAANRHARPPASTPAAASAFSAEQIRTMTAAEYTAARQAILAEYGSGGD